MLSPPPCRPAPSPPPLSPRTPANLGGFRVEGWSATTVANIEDEGTDGVALRRRRRLRLPAGNAVFGIEGEAIDSSADECVTGGAIAGDELCVSAGRDLYVGGRVGAVVGGNTLLYAKAGYTNARVRVDYEDGTAGDRARFHRAHQSRRRSAPAPARSSASARNAYVRTEYRYSNYQDGVDRHQVVGGFGFRF